MSRVTRAASRAASRVEDLTPADQENLDTLIDSKPTVVSRLTNTKRSVLGEVAVNDATQSTNLEENARLNIEGTKAVKRKSRKGKKAAKKDDVATDVHHEPCTDKDGIGGLAIGCLVTDPTGDDQTPRETQENSPPGGMITLKIPEMSLQSTPQPLSLSKSREANRTPKFDPDLHRPVNEAEAEAEAETMESLPDNSNDSFVKSISSRTPGASSVVQEHPGSENEYAADDSDSFINRIKSRSPAKLSHAHEDPIGALDALEDEIERVTQDLPEAVDDTLKSPMPNVVNKHNGPSPAAHPKPSVKRLSRQATGFPPKPAARSSRPSQASLHVANTSHKMTAKSNASHLSKSPAAMKASKAHSSSVPGTANKRTSISTRKPAFVPAKSAKQPTQPTFVLPSDAISAKKKEQKEERLKAEQEEIQRRRSFKAKPIRVSSAQNSFPVRATTSSQARASLIRQDEKSGGDDPQMAQKVAAARTARAPSEGNGHALTVAKRPSSSTVNLISRPRVPQSRSNSSGGRSRTSSGAPNPGPVVRSTVTKADALRQKARAKEICGRDRAAQEERERQRREKEGAARKARAEAAERGRIASREWAEKQKRKLETEK